MQVHLPILIIPHDRVQVNKTELRWLLFLQGSLFFLQA
ncbi:MAG: hypothetical protein ISP65_03865 [Flavobacteriaceae bacterium]|nr:hypothetical protein [Flavobacteriaceae bacterium]